MHLAFGSASGWICSWLRTLSYLPHSILSLPNVRESQYAEKPKGNYSGFLKKPPEWLWTITATQTGSATGEGGELVGCVCLLSYGS